MYSNSSIFSFDSDFGYLSMIRDKFQDELDNVIVTNEYLSVARFTQTHTLLYILGAGVILIIFILTEII